MSHSRFVLKSSLVLLLGQTISFCGKFSEDKKSTKSRHAEDAQGNSQDYRAFSSAPLIGLEQIEDLATKPQTIRPELANAFCVHVKKLPLKINVDKELAVLCDGDKPSSRMADLDRLQAYFQSETKPVQLALAHQGEYTEAMFATSFAIPVPPKWVRGGNIHKHLARPSSFPYAVLYGEVTANLNKELGGSLQFSKQNIFYRTTTTTDDGNTFVNERRTQFDAYQVQGGNPDIGYVTEYLSEANADYQYFNTTHLTIANHQGGSVIITVVALKVKNNGYPDTTAKVINDIMLSQSTNVHDGLMDELKPYYLPSSP